MSAKDNKKDLDQYLAEARSWETDKVREAEKSKKVAWRVASAAGVTAFMAVTAVAMLSPLKKVEPYVIRVDNSTGIVDVVESLKDGKTNYDEAINKYFVQWYVRYREGYTRDLADDYYNYVGLMSGSTEQQKYYQWFNPKDPLSPLNVYGAYAKVNIQVLSTSFISPNIAMVRYIREVQRGGENKPQTTHWAATITFHYTKAPISEKDRAINPLGFQVTDYRNDPETVGTSGDAAQAVQQAPSPAVTSGVTLMPGQQAPADNATKLP